MAGKTEAITCISVQQPFADDIFFRGKWAENRSWPTAYRGELWIHASKIAEGELSAAKECGVDLRKASPTGLMTGYILGCVELYDCLRRVDLLAIAPAEYLDLLKVERPPLTDQVAELKDAVAKLDPITWDHLGDSEWVWILSRAEMLHDPLPALGRLRLWKHDVATDRLKLAMRGKKKWTVTTRVSPVALDKR